MIDATSGSATIARHGRDHHPGQPGVRESSGPCAVPARRSPADADRLRRRQSGGLGQGRRRVRGMRGTMPHVSQARTRPRRAGRRVRRTRGIRSLSSWSGPSRCGVRLTRDWTGHVTPTLSRPRRRSENRSAGGRRRGRCSACGHRRSSSRRTGSRAGAGRPTAHRTPASWPGCRRRWRSGAIALGGGGTIVARYASNDPNSPGDLEEVPGVADRHVDLGPVADDPRIGHQPLPVRVVEGGDDRGIEAAERRPGTPPLAQDRRPRQAGLERLEGEPLEQLDGAGDRPAPLVVVVGDHHRVRSRSRPRSTTNSEAVRRRRSRGAAGQGTGASAKSVLRRSGSALALAALKTARKTSPETFFVPAEPMSVTLGSGPTRRDRAGRA